jgi:hypothetical protein
LVLKSQSKNISEKFSIEMHICNPSPSQSEAEGIQGQSKLHIMTLLPKEKEKKECVYVCVHAHV